MSLKETSIPDAIKDEIYSRVSSFFGASEFSKIRSAFVVVVGLGGVGSHCAHMLVRSGIPRIRLIDFDQVSLSSLNRHAVADLSDVGIPKVSAMKQKLNSIVPWCEVETYNEMFCEDQADKLLGGKPDMVIDCIDDVATKAQLIAYCIAHDLPVITSMGAGGKADPTKIRIGTLADCVKDPLASKMKWKLKKLHKIESEQVSCIFSVEKPSMTLLPLDEEQSSAPDEYGAVDNFRIRVMPVLGTSPAIFGQSLASYVLCKLTNYPLEPESTEAASKSFKHKMKQLLEANELRRYGTKEYVNLDDEDIEFIVRQVWGSRCAVTHNRLGCHFPFTLARWNESLPPTPDNIILVTQRELLLMERARDGDDTSKQRKSRKERKGKHRDATGREGKESDSTTAVKTFESESSLVVEKVEADSVEEEQKKRMRAERFSIPYKEKSQDTAAKKEGKEKLNKRNEMENKLKSEAVDPVSDASVVKENDRTTMSGQYLSDEVISRIESRLQWAGIVCSDKKKEVMTHHLTAEEEILKEQWTNEMDIENRVATSSKIINSSSESTSLPTFDSFRGAMICSVVGSICFGLGLIASKYFLKKQ